MLTLKTKINVLFELSLMYMGHNNNNNKAPERKKRNSKRKRLWGSGENANVLYACSSPHSLLQSSTCVKKTQPTSSLHSPFLFSYVDSDSFQSNHNIQLLRLSSHKFLWTYLLRCRSHLSVIFKWECYMLKAWVSPVSRKETGPAPHPHHGQQMLQCLPRKSCLLDGQLSDAHCSPESSLIPMLPHYPAGQIHTQVSPSPRP